MSPQRRFDASWMEFAVEVSPWIVAAFYAEAPKRTGAYAHRIHVRADGAAIAVVADDPLSSFIIGGTRPHVITPRRPDGVLRFVAEDGTVVFARRVQHPGTRPNPFHLRAWEQLQERVVASFGAHVGRAMRVEIPAMPPFRVI